MILPELGEDLQKATVACWHVAEGSQVKADDDLVELVTDKASFSVPAQTTGILKEILVQPGQDVAIGETLAIIEPMKNSPV